MSPDLAVPQTAPRAAPLAAPQAVPARGQRPPRDPSIEAVRGLACLMVVVFHVFGAGPAVGLSVPAGTTLRVAVDALDLVHMPVFALVGGLVYAFRPPARAGLGGYAAKKARRILLPLIVGSTLFAMAHMAMPGTNGHPPRSVWALYLMPYAHFWYLQALTLVLIVVVAVDLALPRRPAVLAGLFAASVVGFALRGQLGGPAPFAAGGALYLLPFFVMGIGVTRYGGRAGRRAALGALVLGAAAFAALVWGEASGALPRPAEHALRLVAGGGLALGLLRCGAFGRGGPATRALVAVGAMSYTIYLYHVFGTAGARILLEGWGVSSLGVLAAAATAAGVLLPMAFHKALVRVDRITGFPLGLVMAGIDAPRRDPRSPLPVASPNGSSQSQPVAAPAAGR